MALLSRVQNATDNEDNLLVYSRSAWLNVMMQIFLCVLFITSEWAFPILYHNKLFTLEFDSIWADGEEVATDFSRYETSLKTK